MLLIKVTCYLPIKVICYFCQSVIYQSDMLFVKVLHLLKLHVIYFINIILLIHYEKYCDRNYIVLYMGPI